MGMVEKRLASLNRKPLLAPSKMRGKTLEAVQETVKTVEEPKTVQMVEQPQPSSITTATTPNTDDMSGGAGFTANTVAENHPTVKSSEPTKRQKALTEKKAKKTKK